MFIRYVRSNTRKAQGNYREAKRRIGKNKYINELGNGNGNWWGYDKADILVDGKSFGKQVLEFYKRKNLSEDLKEKFENDIDEGKIIIKDEKILRNIIRRK